jgi:hypothetical protein
MIKRYGIKITFCKACNGTRSFEHCCAKRFVLLLRLVFINFRKMAAVTITKTIIFTTMVSQMSAIITLIHSSIGFLLILIIVEATRVCTCFVVFNFKKQCHITSIYFGAI